VKLKAMGYLLNEFVTNWGKNRCSALSSSNVAPHHGLYYRDDCHVVNNIFVQCTKNN